MAGTIDVTGPDRESQIAGSRPCRQNVGAVLDRRSPPCPHAWPELGDDEATAHSRDRILAGGVDVGHADGVGGGERHAQVVSEVARS